jgi:hypothetical protein
MVSPYIVIRRVDPKIAKALHAEAGIILSESEELEGGGGEELDNLIGFYLLSVLSSSTIYILLENSNVYVLTNNIVILMTEMINNKTRKW